MAMSAYFGTGDGAVSGAINLAEVGAILIERDSLDGAPIDINGQRFYQIVGNIGFFHSTLSARWQAYRNFQTMLLRARTAAGDWSSDPRATFSYQRDTGHLWQYWDVVDGFLDDDPDEWPNAIVVPFTLTCLPYARGDELTLQNRLSQSTRINTVAGGAWTLTETSATGGQADPLGGTTAYKLNGTTTNTSHLLRQDDTTTASATITFQCYVKPAQYTTVRLDIRNAANTAVAQCVYTLTGAGSTSGLSGTGAAASITAVDHGWYRCRISVPNPNTTSRATVVLHNGSGVSFAGNTSSGIYIWRPSLWEGVTPPDSYIHFDPDTVGGTLPADDAGRLVTWLTDVPGDVPALVAFDIEDTSSSGVVQSLTISRYAANGAARGDVTLILPSTEGADASSSSASASYLTGFYRVLTTSSAWQEVATFTTTLRGLFDAALLVYDSTGRTRTTLEQPTATETGGGSLDGGAYLYLVVGKDGSGNVVAISDVQSVATPTERNGADIQTVTNSLIWSSTASVTEWWVYFKYETEPWQYIDTGSSAVTYTHSSNATAVTGDPPTALDILPAYLRATVKYGDHVIHVGKPTTGNGIARWEPVPVLSAVALPGLARGEFTDDPAVTIAIEAKQGGGSTSEVRVDALLMTPALRDGGYLHAEAKAALTDAALWRIDHPRHGGTAVQLLDPSDESVVGYARPLRGSLTALPAPFGNAYLIVPRVADGAFAYSTTSVRVAARVTPRFTSIGGAP